MDSQKNPISTGNILVDVKNLHLINQLRILTSLFKQLDERGQVTTLALLATAVKLHPRVPT